jgi:hypothetical protein
MLEKYSLSHLRETALTCYKEVEDEEEGEKEPAPTEWGLWSRVTQSRW